MALDLKERTPKYIQNIPLWKEFLDVLTVELGRLKTEMTKKTSYLDINSYTDFDDLRDVAEAFGYSPVLNIAGEDLDYLKQDVNSIIFKIKNKGTLYYYDYVFKLIPYTGKTYIVYYDDTAEKMVRGIDITTTLSNLNLADYTEPFTGVQSVLYGGYEYNDKYALEGYLDYLSDEGYSVTRTKHLAFEYLINEILTSDGTEYLMTANYLRYLERAIDYGRRATTIPHIGAQLSLLMDETGYYDTRNIGGDYSVPDLKIVSSVTNWYQYSPNVQVSLDSSGQELDSAIQWYLDNDEYTENIKTDENQLYSLYAGVGTKDLIKTSEYLFYPLTEELILYFPFDKETERTVEDLSLNNWTAEIIGDYEYIQGIINQCIQYNGTDTEIKVSSYSISSGDITYSFWIRGVHADQLGTTPYMYYHSGLMDIYYNIADTKLYVTLTGSLGSVTLSSSITLSDAVDNFIVLKQDVTNATLELYINDTLVDSDVLTGLGVFNSGTDAYLGSKNGSNYFKGLIDDFRIYNKLLDSNQTDYMYTEKKGTLAYLNDQVYSKPIIANQRYVDSDWKIVQGFIPAKTINNEHIEEGDGITQSFSGTLRYSKIRPNYVDFTFTDTGTDYTITDDGEGLVGTLSGTGVTGTITYLTGAYTLTFTTKTPDDNTFILAEYKTDDDVEITEIGIADEDDHVVAYATFPPIQFKDMSNHLGIEFCIKKS